LDQLEGDLSTLLTIDTEIQERLKTSSAEERPLNARLEHDFNYVWVGLRQFNEPHLKRSSINTLEETLSSLKGLQRSFTGRFNPIPPLGNVICVLKGLDCR
jgi:hypothetical protein